DVDGEVCGTLRITIAARRCRGKRNWRALIVRTVKRAIQPLCENINVVDRVDGVERVVLRAGNDNGRHGEKVYAARLGEIAVIEPCLAEPILQTRDCAARCVNGKKVGKRGARTNSHEAIHRYT